MKFIRKIIGPDEKLIGICSIHWIYGARGLVWLTGFLLLGMFVDTILMAKVGAYVSADMFVFMSLISDTVFWICALLGVFIFLPYFFMMIGTEIGLTNKRIIIKKGVFFVEIKEADLEEFKGAEVDNGIFGRILDYGYLVFDARFIANVNLPAIANPYGFVKALNAARSNLRQDSMTVVLEDKPEVKAAQVPAAAPVPGEGPHDKPPEIKKVSDIKNQTGAGPIVFQKDILKEVVKDNFSETAGS